MLAVTIEDIRAARERVRGAVNATPVFTSRSFNERAKVEAFFKCENLQRGGSFKIRGATNFLYSLPEAERAHGVVAYSSGNHAQAVAIAARSLGMKATLVMPSDAPKSKVEATLENGGQIVSYDRHTASREEIAQRIADESGAVLVPPFDHPRIIAGQGTCGLELMEQVPDIDSLLVPLGGGGLLSGCAVAAKSLNSGLRIFGVEPALGDDYHRSLHCGEIVQIDSPPTIADGLRTTRPGEITFPLIRALVRDVILVSEDEIREATKFLVSRLKLLVEPSGAVAAAAVLFGKLPAGLRRAGIIFSGGNVDLDVLGLL